MVRTDGTRKRPEQLRQHQFAHLSMARSPRWRWERAQFLAVYPEDLPEPIDDAPTLAAVEFIKERNGQLPSELANSAIAKAAALFEEAGERKWRLEATILTGISPQRVAQKLNWNPNIVTTYESLFFDVRSRLHARSWVAAYTFGTYPSQQFTRDNLAALWQWVGYHYGEHALDLVYAQTTGVGRENYTAEMLEGAELFILLARMDGTSNPERLFQLNLRLMAEKEGTHPSSYHCPSSRKKKSNTTGLPKRKAGIASPIHSK